MNRAWAGLAFVLLALQAVAQEPAGEPRPIGARPVTMFNQSLYYGSFSKPVATAYDRKHDELWVADGATGRIGVFRPDGAELYSFESRDHLRNPSRLAIAPKGRLAVVDGDSAHVRLFDYRGTYKGDLALEGIGEKPLIGALTWDAGGTLYVANNRTAEIVVFRPDGSVKLRFGSRGSDEGQFEAITGIAVGADGTIYVADQQALAVQLFDGQGNFIRGWGRHEMGASNVSLPSGIALDAKERILLTDELRHLVKIFDRNGSLLAQFGGLGNGMGQLSFPTDVATDSKNHVFVTERLTARVQVFEIVEDPAQ